MIFHKLFVTWRGFTKKNTNDMVNWGFTPGKLSICGDVFVLKMNLVLREYRHMLWIQDNWLVVYLPLWKMMKFASWEYYSQYMESHKIPWFQSTNQIMIHFGWQRCLFRAAKWVEMDGTCTLWISTFLGFSWIIVPQPLVVPLRSFSFAAAAACSAFSASSLKSSCKDSARQKPGIVNRSFNGKVQDKNCNCTG